MLSDQLSRRMSLGLVLTLAVATAGSALLSIILLASELGDQQLQLSVTVMQYAIVFLLIVLSYNSFTTFRNRSFLFITLGWVANLSYLVASSASIVHDYVPLSVLIEKPFVFLSSAFFWFAARSHPSLKSPFLCRGLSTRTAIVVWVAILLWVGVFHYLFEHNVSEAITRGLSIDEAHRESFVLFLSSAIPDVFVDVVALWTVALLFNVVAAASSSSRSLLYFGTIFYASIQLLYFFTNTPKIPTIWVVVIGFSLGMMAKILIAVGMTTLLSASAERAREQGELLKIKRRTIERVGHEVGTPLSEITIHITNLEREAGKRGMLTDSLRGLDSAVQRIGAIMDAMPYLDTLEEYIRDPHRRVLPNSPMALRGFSPVRVNTLVQTALMAVKETRDEDIRFSIHYSGNCCISCIASELVQILINVFRNSYDASEGEGDIDVETLNIKEGGVKYAKITIADNGSGVPEHLLDTVFTEGVTTRSGLGRGFGLAVVNDLVKNNTGTVNLENVITYDGDVTGCRVTLRFPRVRCPNR